MGWVRASSVVHVDWVVFFGFSTWYVWAFEKGGRWFEVDMRVATSWVQFLTWTTAWVFGAMHWAGMGNSRYNVGGC